MNRRSSAERETLKRMRQPNGSNNLDGSNPSPSNTVKCARLPVKCSRILGQVLQEPWPSVPGTLAKCSRNLGQVFQESWSSVPGILVKSSRILHTASSFGHRQVETGPSVNGRQVKADPATPSSADVYPARRHQDDANLLRFPSTAPMTSDLRPPEPGGPRSEQVVLSCPSLLIRPHPPVKETPFHFRFCGNPKLSSWRDTRFK